MKNFLKIILIAFLILGFSAAYYPSLATKDPELDLGSENVERPSGGLDEIVRKIESLFPKVEGKIISVEENTVRVNLGAKNGISPQMRFEIFREGKEFFHPTTKAVMGRFETKLGLLEVKNVMDETFLGLILEKKEGINTGDKVRITSGRINIAFIFTERADKDAVGSFYEALDGTGRFRIIEDEKVRSAIEKDGLKRITADTKEDIKRLGMTLDIEWIVILETRPTPKGPFLKADLIHTFDGKLRTYEAFIPTFEKKAIELPLPERKDYWMAFNFDYRARLLGIGDLDGDGRNETVISDGTRVRIYRFEGSNLLEIWADKERVVDNHIAIDIADINRDGKAEIFVTNYSDYLKSFVIEYRDGEYKRIWDNVPLFFRVINIPEKGETLIAQGLDSDIYEYSSKESGYIKEKPLKLLPGVGIYGFAFVDWERKGSYQLLFIDEDDYLNLYSLDGGMIWKSRDRYGGYVLSFDKRSHRITEEGEKVRVKGRIIIKDYPEEKREKAIIIRNIPLTYLFREFRGYKEAEVTCLSWNGSEMMGEWRIGKIDGFIADYGAEDLTNIGKGNLCLLMNPTIRIIGGKSVRMPGLGDVISGKSYLLLYNFPKR